MSITTVFLQTGDHVPIDGIALLVVTAIVEMQTVILHNDLIGNAIVCGKRLCEICVFRINLTDNAGDGYGIAVFFFVGDVDDGLLEIEHLCRFIEVAPGSAVVCSDAVARGNGERDQADMAFGEIGKNTVEKVSGTLCKDVDGSVLAIPAEIDNDLINFFNTVLFCIRTEIVSFFLDTPKRISFGKCGCAIADLFGIVNTAGGEKG